MGVFDGASRSRCCRCRKGRVSELGLVPFDRNLSLAFKPMDISPSTWLAPSRQKTAVATIAMVDVGRMMLAVSRAIGGMWGQALPVMVRQKRRQVWSRFWCTADHTTLPALSLGVLPAACACRGRQRLPGFRGRMQGRHGRSGTAPKSSLPAAMGYNTLGYDR